MLTLTLICAIRPSKIKDFLNGEYPNYQLAYDDFADKSLDFRAYPNVSVRLENDALPPEPTCLYMDPASIRLMQEDGDISHVSTHVSIFDDTRGFIPNGGMARTVSAGSPVIDQLDVFNADTFGRISGLSASDFTVTVFRNNQDRGWAVLTGTNVPTSSVSSGTVYLNEIPTNPGFYSLRWYPDSLGYWRIVLRYDSTDYIKDYEVLPKPSTAASISGLVTSFYP